MQINELLKTNANVTLSVNILDLKEWAVDLIENAKNDFQGERKEQYLTQKKVEDILNVTHSTLWRWNKTGYLERIRVGGKVRYRLSDIERILQEKH